MNLKGKVVEFVSNGAFAVVDTDLGKAYLDINDALDYRLRIGDDIEVEEAGGYITNGQLITILGYKYKLNGLTHTISEQQNTRGETS